MNNGTYTLSLNAVPEQVGSSGIIEFGSGIPGQKVLVFSGIALPEIDTDDDNDVGHPGVVIRLGRFVHQLLSSSVVVGLASIANDDSGFVLATDSASAEVDLPSGELILKIGCGLSGDDTWIHRIGYQAVFVIKEDAFKITGQIDWTPDLHDASNDTASTIAALLHVRSGQLVPVPGGTPGGFGNVVWRAYNDGAIIGVHRNGDSWIATFEILGLPVVTPIHVVVDVAPAFAGGRTDVGAFRVAGPDPILLTGAVPKVDGANFHLGLLPVVR